MTANLTALLYLVASICFIMALRGLSSPETSRGGNLYGIVGMVIAIATTVAQDNVLSYGWIAAAILIGGAIGTFIALKIEMTALPQLVAAFHSLVGLAAVFVAAAAFHNPEAYGLVGADGAIKAASLIEMSIGSAIGAITFTGSVIAFGKLQGLITGAPLVFPGQHPLNALLGIAMVAVTVVFVFDPSPAVVLAADGDCAAARLPSDPADRRRRHAGRDLDAEQLFGLGCLRHRLHAAEQPADHHRRAGWIVGRDPLLHHVQGDEPLDRQRDPGRLRHRGRGRRPGRIRRQVGQGGQRRGCRLHHEERL